MEIKIQCGCGAKYKFEVEPVNGRMPVPAVCPNCGANGTYEANQQIAQKLGTAASAPAPAAAYAPAAAPAYAAAPAPAQPPPAPGSGGRLRVTGVARAVASALTEGEQVVGTMGHGESNKALLDRTIFFVKERVAALKLTDTYDILDPANGQTIGIAKEEPPVWAKWLRLVIQKHRMPTAINVYEVEGQPPVLSVKRGFTFIRAKLNVSSGGRPLGYFRSKLITIGGGFHVFDHAGQQVAEVKGNFVGWEFRFLDRNGREIGKVTKKSAGLIKELLTSADNYVIALTDTASAGPDTSALLLAAGLSIDVVYKENE